MSQQCFEKLCTELRPYIQNNKTRFEIQFQQRNKWSQHYITLKMKAGCEKWQILLVLGYRQFRKLSEVFYFCFRKFFPLVYLTKQHNYFTDRKSYRTSLLMKTQHYTTLYAKCYFHYIGEFSECCKNLSNIHTFFISNTFISNARLKLTKN